MISKWPVARSSGFKISLSFNPRPGSDFHNSAWQGGGLCDPPYILKVSAVAHRNKNSLLLLTSSCDWWYFFTLGQYLTQLCQPKGQFSGKSTFLQLNKTIVTQPWQLALAMKSLPSCSAALQYIIDCICTVPVSVAA